MNSTAPLLYTSPRSWRSLWQEYRVYENRIEIDSCVGTKVIPAGVIQSVEVRPPLVVADAFRGKPFAFWCALKLDLADLATHVAIHRTEGVFKNLRITPDDPARFAAACNAMRGRAAPDMPTRAGSAASQAEVDLSVDNRSWRAAVSK